MEMFLSLALGVALSATCGFRIFVPLLGMGIASQTGHLELSSQWAWMGSTPALACLSLATLLEVAAFYVPYVDHLLDVIAAPAAAIAGTMASAAVLGDGSPFLIWSLAAVAGGGSALAVHGGMASVRALSLGTTGGLANPVVSTLELGASVLATVMALMVPLLLCALLALGLLAIHWRRRRSVHAAH